MKRLRNLTESEAAALRDFVMRLQSQVGDRLVDVTLFGSKARGDANATSDIDVLVLVSSDDPKLLSDVRASGFDILLNHGVFLSIHAMSQQQFHELANVNSLYYRNILQDGIPLLPSAA